MNSIVAHLEDLDRSLGEASRAAFDREEIPDLSDAEIATLLETSGRIQKRIEALQVEAFVQVLERAAPMRDDKITAKYGWDRPIDLVRVLTRSETRDANRVMKTARLMSRIRGMSNGEFVPARYPALRAVMVSGAVGIAGLLAAIEPLEQSRDRIFDEDRLEADRQLADLARGIIRDDDGRITGTGPLPAPEDLRMLSCVLVAYLDPDGAEPSDKAGARARSFMIGRERDGRVPIRGDILPEVAGQLQLLTDSILNPRVDGPHDPTIGVHFTNSEDDVTPNDQPHSTARIDVRTRTQKLHDAFAMIVNAAARAGEF